MFPRVLREIKDRPWSNALIPMRTILTVVGPAHGPFFNAYNSYACWTVLCSFFQRGDPFYGPFADGSGRESLCDQEQQKALQKQGTPKSGIRAYKLSHE